MTSKKKKVLETKTTTEQIEEFTEQLIGMETEKLEEEQATLTVEKGESQDIGADYDMIEVLDHNIKENVKIANKAIAMLSKKEAQRVLMKVLETGTLEADQEGIKLPSNLSKNIFELCNQIEMDKRGFVLKIQEESFYEMIRQHQANNEEITEEIIGETNE